MATEGFRALATGFLLGFKVGEADKDGKATYKIFLITNRHVFSGHKEVVLRFNLTQAGSKTYNLLLEDDKSNKQWLAHPRDPLKVSHLRLCNF